MAHILTQQPNPDGTLHAVVDVDADRVSLSLIPAPPLEGRVQPRSTWVCDAAVAPEPDALQVVWLQEGDGAALFDGERLIAALPAGSGGSEHPGYAAAATGRDRRAWGLELAPALVERIERDRAWWARWASHDLFTPVRDAQKQAFEEQIGPVERYFAIDRGRWPPRAMVLGKRPPGHVASTLGMALRRQPQADVHLPADAPGRRVELALALHPSVSDHGIWLKVLSSLAALPWRTVSWLGSGHTVSLGSLPAPFGGLFLHPAPPQGLTLAYPHVDDEPVHILWGTPITAAERALAQQYGRERLVERLGEALGEVRVRDPVA